MEVSLHSPHPCVPRYAPLGCLRPRGRSVSTRALDAGTGISTVPASTKALADLPLSCRVQAVVAAHSTTRDIAVEAQADAGGAEASTKLTCWRRAANWFGPCRAARGWSTSWTADRCAPIQRCHRGRRAVAAPHKASARVLGGVVPPSRVRRWWVGPSPTCRHRRDGLPADQGGANHANLCVDEHAHR
jgi:hypothetical protein